MSHLSVLPDYIEPEPEPDAPPESTISVEAPPDQLLSPQEDRVIPATVITPFQGWTVLISAAAIVAITGAGLAGQARPTVAMWALAAVFCIDAILILSEYVSARSRRY